MSDRPLYAPDAKQPTGHPVWVTFLIAGAKVCLGILGLGIFWRALARYEVPTVLAVCALVAAFVGGLAVWYWLAVRKITGTWRGAWSLPDGATVAAAVPPPDALRRVLNLAKGRFVWPPWTASDSTVTLTRQGWRGETSVRIAAIATEHGSRLDFNVTPGTHVDNLVGRAIIARLLREIAANTEWKRL